MDHIKTELLGETMRLEFNFDVVQLIYACLQLPVPLWILFHLHRQKARAYKLIQLEHDAPVLLPIYNYIIYAEILYVVTKFLLYGFLYPHMDFGDRSGDPIVADSVFHAFMFMILADGMAVFMLVLIFSFLISPTAGKNSLSTSLRKGILHGGFYVVLGVFCMSALAEDYRRAYYVLQVVAPMTVVIFLINSLYYMYKKKSGRWKAWLYRSVWLTLFLWVLYTAGCIAKLSGAPNIYVTGLRYFVGTFYAFVLPYVYYQALIQDSIYWRNLDKYLFPTADFGLNSPLLANDTLQNDGLGSLCLSQEKGHLDDTLSNFKVPLIDFMHLESATGLLGKGGYAMVWKSMYHGSPVAVKELLNEKISIKHIKSFFREAVLSTKLDHPNILKFHGACVQPPEFLMIFEWCNRGDLGNFLVKEVMYLNRRTRLDMAAQATNGLQTLHQRGLIHRDVKPANYLVHVEGHQTIVKLADFGSCRSMHDKLPLFEGVSPLFVAPEIRKLIPKFFDHNGDPIKNVDRPILTYSNEVDVFGLGWVLWAIFKEEDYKQVLKEKSPQIFHGSWMPEMQTDEWDEEIVEIIDGCWKIRSSHRPTSEEVYDSLFSIQRKHCESYTRHEVTLSFSNSSENTSRTNSPKFFLHTDLEIAARQFQDGMNSFMQDIRRLHGVLGEKPQAMAKEVLQCAERLNIMALNGIMDSSVDQTFIAVSDATYFPYSICRLIMRFRQAFENDVEDFTISQVTTAFARTLHYEKSRLIRRKCQVFQFEPNSSHREECSYSLSNFSQREKMVYDHNKKMFAPLALEYDQALLWQSDIDLWFPGFESTGDQFTKSVFPMYNFDGNGKLFIMLVVMFPYYDSKRKVYGSFSLQKRVDFHPRLKKSRDERQLLRIYDSFMRKNKLVRTDREVLVNRSRGY